MLIYFEKFGTGSTCKSLTAGRLYEVIKLNEDVEGRLWLAKIDDDKGVATFVNLGDRDLHTDSEWTVLCVGGVQV